MTNKHITVIETGKDYHKFIIRLVEKDLLDDALVVEKFNSVEDCFIHLNLIYTKTKAPTTVVYFKHLVMFAIVREDPKIVRNILRRVPPQRGLFDGIVELEDGF